jgi:hypothetical protein
MENSKELLPRYGGIECYFVLGRDALFFDEELEKCPIYIYI